MPIRYIHNDPACVPYLETLTPPSAARDGRRARFATSLPDETVHGVGSGEFVDWQCHEAAARALAVWESVAMPLRYWHGRKRSIALLPRRQTGIGASYERNRIGFDYHPHGAPVFFTGASADAVAHEIGHAILDAIRPDLWDSIFTEVAAFHEGFADCLALLVALNDPAVTDALLAGAPQPGQALAVRNIASQVAESVAHYHRGVHGADSGASVPRRLLNHFNWALPVTLPPNSTPTNLAREPHSFGQVFAGCIYDLVANIYVHGGNHNAAGLGGAALIAGTLLAAAIESVPQEARFFRAVGRAMIHTDDALTGGIHHLHIRDAFNAHNVQLGSSAMLDPGVGLDGPPPARRGPAAHHLNRRTRADLVRRLGAADARVSAQPARVGVRRLVRATIEQPLEVELRAAGSPRVIAARASQDVLLDGQRGHCVMLGETPNPANTFDEANSFVEALDDGGLISEQTKDSQATHRIVQQGRGSVLKRIRFACFHTAAKS